MHFEFRCEFRILNVLVTTLYIEHNGQAPVLRHCCKGIYFPLKNLKSSLARFRTKTFYTPSSRNKRGHNVDEIKTSLQEGKLLLSIAKFISTRAITLEIRTSNVANRTFLSVLLNLKVFVQYPSLWRSWLTSKLPNFSRPYDFTRPVGSKKSTLGCGFKNIMWFRWKDSQVSCG